MCTMSLILIILKRKKHILDKQIQIDNINLHVYDGKPAGGWPGTEY